MKKPYISYISALLLFGSNGVIASLIKLNSTEIVFFRALTGSAFLLAVFFIMGNRFSFYKHRKQFFLLLISGAAMGASWMFLYEAYVRVGVSVATLIYYCGPVLVMAVSLFIFKEKMSLSTLSGFVCVLCGIFLINGFSSEGNANVFGLFCAVMSAVTYAVMVLFNRAARDITGLENSVLQLCISFVTVAVFVGIKQGFAIRLVPSDILPIIILGFVNTGIGCYLYFSSIGRLPVKTVAILGYLEPLSAVVFSMIFLGEAMLPLQLLGAALIIGGAVIGECVKDSHSSEQTKP